MALFNIKLFSPLCFLSFLYFIMFFSKKVSILYFYTLRLILKLLKLLKVCPQTFKSLRAVCGQTLQCRLPSSTSSLSGWRRWCVPLSSPPAAPGGTPTPHNRACSFRSNLDNIATQVCMHLQHAYGTAQGSNTHTHMVGDSRHTRVSSTKVGK